MKRELDKRLKDFLSGAGWPDGDSHTLKLAEDSVHSMMGDNPTFPLMTYSSGSMGIHSMVYVARQRILTLERTNRSLKSLIK